MIALIPTPLCGGSGEVRAFQAVDTVVDPSCRGQGVFVKLGELAQDPVALGAQLLWGFPNASAAPGWYGKLRWTDFGPVPLLVRPLRSSFVLRRLHEKLGLIDFPLIRRVATNSLLYDDGAALETDVEHLWRRIAPQFGIAVQRGGAWMRWRLQDKPGTNYRCVGIKPDGGNLEAFVATKIVEKHGARLCYVMEAISTPEGKKSLVSLLSSELSLAARKGAEAALAWCPKAAPNYRAYRSAGFFPFPLRLRPIEINFGARALLPEAALLTQPNARWYVSFLDSDTN